MIHIFTLSIFILLFFSGAAKKRDVRAITSPNDLANAKSNGKCGTIKSTSLRKYSQIINVGLTLLQRSPKLKFKANTIMKILIVSLRNVGLISFGRNV